MLALKCKIKNLAFFHVFIICLNLRVLDKNNGKTMHPHHQKIKTVAVLIQELNQQPHILVFKHPKAGIQMVKGTVEEHESLEAATLRELFEESGIRHASVERYLGIHTPDHIGPVWHVYLCESKQPLPEYWSFFCEDDGGLHFDFQWHPLHQPATDEWHPLFQELLQFVQHALK